MGSIFPEELGGSGLGYVEYSIIIEELSRVDGSVGIIVAAHTSLCSNHIFKMASDEQRARDRKSTRLNSSHVRISYAVFCLKKKKNTEQKCTRKCGPWIPPG